MRFLISLLLLSMMSCQSHKNKEKSVSFDSHWSFFQGFSGQKPRGGTTTGPTPNRADEHPGWTKLQQTKGSNFAKDRAAILAMTGTFQANFEFFETYGLSPDYKLVKPYQSWGTEYVFVVDDNEKSISLQHILIMYFEHEGKVQGPMVMKHWRQDWHYEKQIANEYQGYGRYLKKDYSQSSVKGKWLQEVYQVDDSPRYQVYGSWHHLEKTSVWKSENSWRPLPRREYSVRNDYNVLEGTHHISIRKKGWVHEQNNLKLNLATNSKKNYLSKETGINRYLALKNFDTKPGEDYWKKTKLFWQTVREYWKEIFANHEAISVAKKVNGKAMWEILFAAAEAANKLSEKDRRELVRKKLDPYVNTKAQVNDQTY